MTQPQTAPARPRVVIVGAGFGGLALAKGLADAPCDVTLIDRRNHHLFQPLLYQVATAGLAPTQIASPIRSVVRGQANTRVILGEVAGVDRARRQVKLSDRVIPYDILVLATGATHAYFGHDDWEAFAPGLKTLEDAIDVRRRVLLAFERAELTDDAAERERLLTFVIIGAGPTGVELAGAIAELARRAISCDFRVIQGAMARVYLVEAGPRVLTAFPPHLSAYAARALEKLGVTVATGRAVTACDALGVELDGKSRIEARTLVWAAGVRASPAATWLEAERDRAGRAMVGADLSVAGAPDIFVIGDAAHAQADGKPLPGVAPVAKQQGEYLARLIKARLADRPAPGPFRYKDYGNLATVGRQAAVVAIGKASLKGFIAWLFWGAAHVYFLIGFRNRIAVTLDWLWAYITFDRGSRLITGDIMPKTPEPAPRAAARRPLEPVH
ncbi:NADH dehydrogenase [Caulobacter ginsengisoli]|uniref:NADH:ubiquinone reductase (non-electrogenic) n=1 Tax=Caulobacter ginsengisoli TaxID=400775 RepID=A0ABU0IRE2_9CAUL|nr:NAD(P)/FAD-dependent oxidoreductase [Caulobacter ginsengisoli]MDQ0464574.1 NADH dehydrogenase [Caulobacter ginsengisoli]